MHFLLFKDIIGTSLFLHKLLILTGIVSDKLAFWCSIYLWAKFDVECVVITIQC